VLLEESVDALHVRDGSVVVDGTFGRGGHSRAVLARMRTTAEPTACRLIAFDKDPQAIAEGHALEATCKQSVGPAFEIVHDSFASMQSALMERGLEGADAILLDLGVSSPQLDEAERGFSFRNDGPLDMRMDPTRGMSAAEYVNTAEIGELTKVIRDYGEERFAFQVAKAIVARRAIAPIIRTLELAQIVAGAVKTRERGQDPATRTFQALRIHVNQELEDLQVALEQAVHLLNPHGRLAIISFHSLEDRIVKQFMHAASRIPAALARLPLRESELPPTPLADVMRILPSDEEVARNARARSAVLRVATRTTAPWSAAHSHAYSRVVH
jgi:16S rRNA (cytosine1402-N4)-methyltransferase